MTHSDARPDPEGLDFEALLTAYDDVLWGTMQQSIRYPRYHDPSHDPDALDVWTPAGKLVHVKRYVEQRTGAEIEFDTVRLDMQARLVAVLNALDADVGRVLEDDGHRAEIEELYLGLRRLEKE